MMLRVEILSFLLALCAFGNIVTRFDHSLASNSKQVYIDPVEQNETILKSADVNGQVALNEKPQSFASQFLPSIRIIHHTDHPSVVRFDEHFIARRFIQYIYYSYQIRVRYRKADILFPFHYFW